ncbi:hypothetical protein CsSME_00044199 [Camellia sinensis var. sinensis]
MSSIPFNLSLIFSDFDAYSIQFNRNRASKIRDRNGNSIDDEGRLGKPKKFAFDCLTR